MAIAFGLRTAGGAFVFPVDIEDRLDDRERQILARIERLRGLDRDTRVPEREPDAAPAPVEGRGAEGSEPE